MVSEVNYHSRANWFNFCAMGGFWITGILLAFYLFHVIEKLHFIPWIMVVSSRLFPIAQVVIKFRLVSFNIQFISIFIAKQEMGYCGVWSFFFLTASAACAAEGSRFEAWAAASVSR